MGAYQGGTNTDLDRALQIRDKMLSFLTQDIDEECDMASSMQELRELVDGS